MVCVFCCLVLDNFNSVKFVLGLNVVSNIRRLQPVNKIKQNPDDPPPITIPLPAPVVPNTMLTAQLQAQLAVAHLHNIVRE